MKRIRKNFGKIRKIVEIPNLIDMQRASYWRFLQADINPKDRENIGLQSVFKSIFPIKDPGGTASLEFISYKFSEAKNNVDECIYRGMTYEMPIRIVVQLVTYDINKETGISQMREAKEQEIYFGTIPLMTPKGTFIINGTERVIVSQLHRSAGVFFNKDEAKNISSAKPVYTSRVIPVRGSWIDMEIDLKDIVYIRIDRRRKFPITLLFKALGYTTEDILNYFYKKEKIIIENDFFYKELNEDFLKEQRTSFDIIDPSNGEIIIKKGTLFRQKQIKKLKSLGINKIQIELEDIVREKEFSNLSKNYFANNISDPKTGDILVSSNEEITLSSIIKLKNAGISCFETLFIDVANSSDCIRKTLLIDKTDTREEALIDIYRRLRPGNPANSEVAQELLDNLFFKSAYYDLSGVGRMKMNLRLGINIPAYITILRKEDILLTTKTLVQLRDTRGIVDDIDHLGNRRVRAVGELLENQYRIGLVRMERAIKERMTMQEVDSLMPNDLINPKPVSAVIKEFFGTSQLSQFMDQTNPLSETTHKRRLSALGPGGLTRDRAGFEVRDVHPSHYGRICPIETPEGPNIGLIVSLSTYARVNDYGFIETPYKLVKEGQVLNEVKFLSAFEEKKHPIAQANIAVDSENKFVDSQIICRVEGEFMTIEKEKIELMDVSPNQLVSVSASLIPFLENDDANRALMGSNMQRQAVPLLTCQAPLVGTGIEEVVAKDSGVTVVAPYDALVVSADASRIVLRRQENQENQENQDNLSNLNKAIKKDDSAQVKIYNLLKFVRSNQNTCINQRPIVKTGDIVKFGDIIADGPATHKGELALGKNIMVAFMPWGGYNFEDSILISERLVRDGVYTSVHIEEFETMARDTKLGKEEISRDIPNVNVDEVLKNLDDSGIIRLGTEVKPGDILVGKITPKGETQLSPEEKLLRAIFGEKAGDVKDTSLRVPPGIEGIVIDVKVFSRRGSEKDDRTRFIEDKEIALLERDRDDELFLLRDIVATEMKRLLEGQKCQIALKKNKKNLINKGIEITSEILDELLNSQLDKDKTEKFIYLFEGILLEDSYYTKIIEDKINKYREQAFNINKKFEEKVSRYEKGDDLLPGVIKLVKVYVAMKRKLSVGDKMAGRHGNKGVVSRILSVEDMPYFEDGKPVDMVLNPLGVPSRMNVGQILEIHLGRAAKGLGDILGKMLEENRVDAIRQKLKEIFLINNKTKDNKEAKNIDSLSKEDLIELAKDYKDGFYVATPVFDGAKEEEIKDLLEIACLSKSGQAVLYDGRTGEQFGGKVTVGTMYMLKLHHLVDDKIHARSIGPYSLVTQQPLGGKAQFGGQRLGEMEVWAMEAYGAAHALQEFITVKSDDMAGRTNTYGKIVKGQNVLEPGLPESFKVLEKELQSLGLNIVLCRDKDK